MKQVTCPDCGATYAANVLSCPTCGCPNDNFESSNENENVQQQPKSQEPKVVVGDSTDDFNEAERYSPFSSASWFFKAPWPLSLYPERKTFDRAHPFLGWLFGPWHLTPKNNGEKEEYAAINNIFYLFNLISKFHLYTFLWAFLKGFPFILLYLLVNMFGMYSLRFVYDYTVFQLLMGILGIFSIFMVAFMTILYCCSLGRALHRYWPAFHRTWRRLSKRYWKSMLSNN